MKRIILLLTVFLSAFSTITLMGEESNDPTPKDHPTSKPKIRQVPVTPPSSQTRRAPSHKIISLLFSENSVEVLPNFDFDWLYVSIRKEESEEEWVGIITQEEREIPFSSQFGLYYLYVQGMDGTYLEGQFFI